jgi:hypothetical protein
VERCNAGALNLKIGGLRGHPIAASSRAIRDATATKRLPSSRCTSAIQIVRPLESIAEHAAPTPTSFAEIVSDDFPVIQGRHSFIVDARYAPKRLIPQAMSRWVGKEEMVSSI